MLCSGVAREGERPGWLQVSNRCALRFVLPFSRLREKVPQGDEGLCCSPIQLAASTFVA